MLIFPFFGNAQTYSVCDCADIMLAMIKEAKGNMTDKDKMEAIKNKYEAKIEKCEKLGDGKSDEEQAKMKEEMKKCPSAKEAEKLMKEMMGENSTEDEEQTKIKIIHERADSFYYKGISKGHYSFRDDYRGAVADFTSAIKLDPKFVEAYCYRGEAKAILNDDMGAMSDFNSALYFIDNNRGKKIVIFAENIVPEIYCMRGSLKNKLGDHRGAITDVSKAISFNDKYTIDEAYF